MDYNTYPQDFTVYPEEKRGLRKIFNGIGITLLVSYLLITVGCMVCYSIFCPETVYDDTGAMVIGTLESFIGGSLPAIFSALTFIGYCLMTKYNPRELFRKESLHTGEIIRSALIILMLQQVSFFCTVFLSVLLDSFGLHVPSLNTVYEHTVPTYAVNAFSSIILAPIAEELVYRGIVLRCAAKISRRFAIFFSAFLFGIMHANPYQFILGFLTGIILAIITIRTGSLLPAILCHMLNNLVATIPSMVEYVSPDTSYIISLLNIPIFLIAGAVAFVVEASSGRLKLPEYTLYHKKRTLPIMFTSWSMLLILFFYAYDLIASISPIEV